MRAWESGRVRPIRIAIIVGTRPEAIKMAPVATEAGQRAGIVRRVLATGQQGALFNEISRECGLTIDRTLGPFSGHLGRERQVASMRSAIRQALAAIGQTDIVLVQGDTNSALAGALAANDLDIAIGHVEAGLRSHDLSRPFPEELNRVAIGGLATLHFAPSEQAATNLLEERVRGVVTVTGNPGIDSMLKILACPPRADLHKILVTCHRRENFGAPLERICDALLALADETNACFMMPVHPNPGVSSKTHERLGRHASISLVAPLPYRKLIRAISESVLVISDSGGLQEECAALGVPLLLTREETERPEVVASGNCILVGSRTDQIIHQTKRLLNDPAHRAAMARPAWPYGTGNAASKILNAIEAWHSSSRT
jgi:UDP-N-acetylglucosamine 2-epimerase (non-hydrolysing)